MHSDHVGDFHAFWISAWTSSSLSGGGHSSLQVIGPNSVKPEYGTRHFVEKQIESFAWDEDSRHGILLAAGANVDVSEFDYSKVQVVYEERGVKITAFPMVHVHDGAVGYRLDYKGMSVVYSGDGSATQWLMENSYGVDVLIHETFPSPEDQDMPKNMPHPSMLVKLLMFAHTPTAVVGKVFEMLQPGLSHTVSLYFY